MGSRATYGPTISFLERKFLEGTIFRTLLDRVEQDSALRLKIQIIISFEAADNNIVSNPITTDR